MHFATLQRHFDSYWEPQRAKLQCGNFIQLDVIIQVIFAKFPHQISDFK